MSAATAVVWPAFALFVLTMLSVARLARLRFAAAKAGTVDARYYKVFKGEGEPPQLAAASRNVVSLHEMPTLFYAGTAIAFAAGEASTALVALGWAYVALRLAHTAVHVTVNRILWRFRAFLGSWIVLAAYWAVLGATLLSDA
jgi:hypothetical protein